jgi:nitrogen regulatory protein PII
MQWHAKKRIEIIVEAVVVARLTELLDRLEVSGYTIVPAVAGRGHGGTWSSDGQATVAGGMVAVTVITSAERLDAVVEPVFALVKRQMGILTVSDVAVLRAEHF